MVTFEVIVYDRITDEDYIATVEIWAEDDIKFDVKQIEYYEDTDGKIKDRILDDDVSDEIISRLTEYIHEYAIRKLMICSMEERYV